jgi:hypothetical protein
MSHPDRAARGHFSAWAKARAVLEGPHPRELLNSPKPLACVAPPHSGEFAADSEGITTSDLVARLLKTIEQPDDKDY